jgi:hypothetical protein
MAGAMLARPAHMTGRLETSRVLNPALDLTRPLLERELYGH